jgi:hypothetical protein
MALRGWLVVMATAGGLAGCGSPPVTIVPPRPLLALRRDRYVLPPEPPAPRPSDLSERERRALEAEWPPVTSLALEPPPPPDGPRVVRQVPRLGPPRPLIRVVR